MRFYIIGLGLMALITSCEGKAKKQMIEQRIIEMQAVQETNDSIRKEASVILTKANDLPVLQENKGDEIIGLWEVNNNYYMAIYEIIKYDNQYYGKVHYFNDGTQEYKGTGGKDDYFLEGIVYADGKYSEGKMHMPDGAVHLAKFILNNNELKVKMTIDEHPYEEVWTRQTREKTN